MNGDVRKKCPMCGKTHAVVLTDEEVVKYKRYLQGAEKIQELFPELGVVEREFLMTGYCYGCQALLFGKRNKPNLKVWRE